MKKRVYLDNNATTALDDRVFECLACELKSCVGNPSSLHSFGRQARAKLIKARQTIASYLGVKPQEIIFTSGGTEGANLILRGLFQNSSPGHIITSDVEHAAVYTTLKALEKQAPIACTFLKVGLYGAVTLQAVKQAIRPDTKAIVLMAVNNETGVKTDIKAIGELAKQHKIPLIVDGVALMGKEAFTVAPGVCAMFFSGHKFHAPKGVGFMFVKSGTALTPIITGGHHEMQRRAGTENVAAIVGMAKAVELLNEELIGAEKKMASLRGLLEDALLKKIPGAKVNGQGPRIANTSNMSFPNSEGEVLLAKLDLAGIAVSHGSACASGALQPSRVLINMGVSQEEANASLRFSLSRFTTEEEIIYAIEVIVLTLQQ